MSMVDWRNAMRSILILSLLITLYSSANAATVHPAHRRHAIVHPNHSVNYAPPRPVISRRAGRYNQFNEPYYGASQGYAPGEKERFLESVMSPY